MAPLCELDLSDITNDYKSTGNIKLRKANIPLWNFLHQRQLRYAQNLHNNILDEKQVFFHEKIVETEIFTNLK